MNKKLNIEGHLQEWTKNRIERISLFHNNYPMGMTVADWVERTAFDWECKLEELNFAQWVDQQSIAANIRTRDEQDEFVQSIAIRYLRFHFPEDSIRTILGFIIWHERMHEATKDQDPTNVANYVTWCQTRYKSQDEDLRNYYERLHEIDDWAKHLNEEIESDYSSLNQGP